MQNKAEKFKKILSNIKVVLYDFDGTLVDSEPWFFRSYSRVFKKYGHQLNKEEYWAHWVNTGNGLKWEMKHYKLSLTQHQISSIYQERRKYYSSYIRQGKIRFIEPVYRTIALFRKAGLNPSIASNSFEDDLKNVFYHAGRRANLPLIGRRTGLRTKPYSDIFCFAAGYHRTAPSDCIVIEDTQKGLDAARNIGMKCIIVPNSLNKHLRFPKADIVFSDPEEFYSITKRTLCV